MIHSIEYLVPWLPWVGPLNLGPLPRGGPLWDLFNSLGITMLPQSWGEVIPATETE